VQKMTRSRRYLSQTLGMVLLGTLLFSVIQLQGCTAAAVSGAATGVAIAHDRRTTGTILDDQAIELKASHALLKNTELWKKSHITVVSYNNVLLLVGQTPNEALRQQAEDVVKDIRRVRKVYNELTIGKPVSFGTRSQDSWITARVKAKMLTTKGVNPARVKVITENSVVYLMGLTTQEEEIIATEATRTIPGIEKVVQVFEHS